MTLLNCGSSRGGAGAGGSIVILTGAYSGFGPVVPAPTIAGLASVISPQVPVRRINLVPAGGRDSYCVTAAFSLAALRSRPLRTTTSLPRSPCNPPARAQAMKPG